MTAPMSEVEVLARLEERVYCGMSFTLSKPVLDDAGKLVLLTAWRDEAVRAEREKIIKLGKMPCPYCQTYTGLPGGACENCMNTGLRYPSIFEIEAALQERPND